MSSFQDLKNKKETKLKVKCSKVVAEFGAMGGEAVSRSGGALNIDPTPAGEYLIYGRERHVSKIWINSKIAWGTPLRVNNGVLEVEIRKNSWVDIKTIDPEFTPEYILNEYNYMIDKIDSNIPLWTKIPNTWKLNDFGPTAVTMYQDFNNNKKFDGKDKIRQEMFHTCPLNHMQIQLKKPVTLSPSHGCIHIKPDDMIAMLDSGYFKSNTTVYVHRYDEDLPSYVVDKSAKAPFSIHFYPGKDKVLIYGH